MEYLMQDTLDFPNMIQSPPHFSPFCGFPLVSARITTAVLDYTLLGGSLRLKLVHSTCRIENINLKPNILLWKKWEGLQEEQLSFQNQSYASSLKQLAGILCCY
jgi:hypothetical protein